MENPHDQNCANSKNQVIFIVSISIFTIIFDFTLMLNPGLTRMVPSSLTHWPQPRDWMASST